MPLVVAGPSAVSETQHLQEKRKSGSRERCEMSVSCGMGVWGETDELKWQGTGC